MNFLVVKHLEGIVQQIRPELVFTQDDGDLNIDPAITFHATLTATRPLTNSPAHTVYAYEVPSSTVAAAASMGLHRFSTPFDDSTVDFLQGMGAPAYKVASCEVVDLPLLRKIAATGKPVIMSTGMATLAEIDEAVATLRQSDCQELALPKCTSAYPALPSTMNLRTSPHPALAFDGVAGLSDHTGGLAAATQDIAQGTPVSGDFMGSRQGPQ